MFEYAKIKAELEDMKCPVHNKAATIVFAEGKISLENVCCNEHQKKLEDMLADVEQHDVADILEDVY
jgi:hypothetical protein